MLNRSAFQGLIPVLQKQFYNRNMSTFVSTVNPVTGKVDWIQQDENYDFHQEIARAAYADMLHDTERNKKYYDALRGAIAIMRKREKPVNVLDIGTGSGLLSMMAANLGADTVTACEAFHPMAKCAKEIIEQNGFSDKILLIPKRSTDIIVGKDADMPKRANILITEVFDTELIGEGAIGTFTHAHKELLEKDCIVIPTLANMYIQLVSSDFIRSWNEIKPIKMKGYEDVLPPDELTSCSGAPLLHDIQMEQLPRECFKTISQPLQVFRFDFSGQEELKFNNVSEVTAITSDSGEVGGILMWWDLQMDTESKIMLSCAPSWSHYNPKEMQWRDHWMQAIYYTSKSVQLDKNEEFKVVSCHDEYSLWFEVTKPDSKIDIPDLPVCNCGAHIAYSRSRLGMMNDPDRRQMYQNILQKNSLQDRVIILEKSPEEITDDDLDYHKIDLVIGEPYFQSTLLPWHNIYFWYAARSLEKHFSDQTVILPRSMSIRALAVEFEDFWKIRAPVKNCEGFDMKVFDDFIEKSSDISDADVEPQPLWEYPCQPMSEITNILTLDFDKFSGLESTKNNEAVIKINSPGSCNAVVLWTDFNFDQNHVLSTGPTTTPCPGKTVKWDMFTRQGVHLFKMPKDNTMCNNILVKIVFKPDIGDIDIKFHYNCS
ncbi:hypothetical protein KUTeg_018922 [Tegillarca granosa]|uniref:Protein arginine N-methyltransferase n=1 Tax=Tegillarca granosa TaxID=220873 RepID=A0ABQ9EB09_TEGGR|nr:hypothetical protein KUTeg_018922 [Tegillarca granosa]